MNIIKENKKYLIVVSVALLLVVILVAWVYWAYPFPLGAKPKSINETKIISDIGAKQTCKVEPFRQELEFNKKGIFQVSLKSSYNNSRYYLEVGDVPVGVLTQFDKQEGRGASERELTIFPTADALPGSFTITVAYHEWQGFNRWLVNYCLFNVVIPKEE